MKSVLDILKKWGLGAMFLLLGVTWILINPLIAYAAEPQYFDSMGITAWDSIGATTWIASFVYIAIGVMLLIRTYKPSVKIPEMAYAIAFGALALFVLIELFSLKKAIIGDARVPFEHLPKPIQTYLVTAYIAQILELIALAGVAALMVLKKYGKFFFVPSGAMAASVLFTIIGAVSYVNYLNNFGIKRMSATLYTGIIFGIVLAAALLAFCYFFVANAQEQEEPQEQETAVDTDNEFAENEVAATESAPKLTAEQQAELDNVKELFELGAYTQEEYEAEKKRIMLGL